MTATYTGISALSYQPIRIEVAEGRIAKVVRIEEEPFCRIDLLPTVNFDSIEELFILKEIKP